MIWTIWILYVMFVLVWVKSTTIGSEFDFTLWYRFRKFYRYWYFHKRVPETFKEYINRVGYKEE